MGFELDRLMKQFGVATPSLNYSGTPIPVDPGVRPVASDTLTGDALTSAQTRYDNLLSKYNIDKASYPADKALYDTYKTEYQNRMLGTPQYMQAQFQTGNEPKSAALSYATSPNVNPATGSGMGLKQFNQNIKNWANQNPTANTSDIKAYADKYGINAQDIYNATDNRWGNVLQVPKYGEAESKPIGSSNVAKTVSNIFKSTLDPFKLIFAPASVINDPVVLPPVIDDPVVYPPVIDDPVVIPPVVYPPVIDDPVIDDPVIDDPVVTVPSIYTKPIVSTITDDVDPNNIPLITPSTPLVLPDFTVLPSPDEDFPPTLRKDVSFWDDADSPDLVGPTRGQPELDESFDPYLVTDTPAITTNTPAVVDTPVVFDNSVAVDDGTTGGIQNTIDSLNDKYEVQDWENLDSSNVGTMAGDFSLNSDKNTYHGDFGGSGFGGGSGGGKYFDDQMMSVSAYAKGGRVKTHFQTGGANQATDIDQMAENYGVAPQPDIMSYQGSKLFPMQAPAPVSDQMTRRDAYPPTPQSPMDARSAQLDALLQRYAGNTTDYSAELAEARKRADTESLAFQKMIQTAMKGSADEAPSKAEMYFRLASAFGSPTKTGHFAETLGNVNKELASYSKEERDARKAQRALQLQMGLKGQEMRMASAKDELSTIKTLAAEGMKDKRTIVGEVIKDFIKSGEPESAAGKQAKDEGLKPGTPAFQKRVNEIAQTSVDAKLAQVTATLAGMSVQQANLALAQSKFQNQQTQQAKLSPAEMKLKTEVEDILTSTDQAMLDLKRAYQLNPNTFDTSLGDVAQRKVLEQAGVKDPKVIATREQTNLLSKSAVGKLKTAFGGNPTEGERKILLDLEGIDSKSKDERAIIMKNSYMALKARREREQKRLNEINQGLYRNTSAPTGELE